MPDLGNLSLSASIMLTRCPNLKPVFDPSDLTSTFLCDQSVKSLATDCIWGRGFHCQFLNNDEVGGACEIRVPRQSADALDRSKKPFSGKTLEDHVKSWVRRKQESGVPESRCSFPFLDGSRKMVISLHVLLLHQVLQVSCFTGPGRLGNIVLDLVFSTSFLVGVPLFLIQANCIFFKLLGIEVPGKILKLNQVFSWKYHVGVVHFPIINA